MRPAVVALLAGSMLALAAAPAASAAPDSAQIQAVPSVPARPAVHAAPAAPVVPAFVQQVSAHGSAKRSISVTPGISLTAGDRLVVEVGLWRAGRATTASVSDSSGDPFVEVTHFTASDGTEMSIWTAPVVTGGSAPAITARPSAVGDMGIIALEYSGLSTVADVTAVDQVSHSVGSTTSAATVQSAATAPTTAANELAVGFYADSGFGDTLSGGTGYTVRANESPASDMEMLAEDQPVSSGATPAASVQTGAHTIWLMASVVFASSAQTAPQAPSRVAASPGDNAASLSWTAPASGGSPITSYTITPYVGSVAQPATVVSGSPPATTTVVLALTNGTTYTFTVSAANSVGTSPPSAASNRTTPSPKPQGQWGSLQTFPMVPISSILMDNGSFIFWDGWQQPEPTEIWNPATPGTFTTINAPDSVFCDGAAQLPDGRIIVVGGYGGLSTGQIGIVDTSIFDPATNAWTRVANMHKPRWYPTLTELSDGRYVAISGNSTNASTWADRPEVYDPATNTWALLSKISTSQVHELEYPFSYLIPNGKVLNIGPREDVTHELNVGGQTWTRVGGASGVVNGSSIQYLPGEILYSGGASSLTSTVPAQATTAVLDTNAAKPVWRQTSPMIYPRIYHTLTMLANGQVLAVGGGPTSDASVATRGVLPTEIWDPTSETWSAAAPIATARNYHSTAVLMPDGRVLVAGGGHLDGLNDAGQDSAQVYSPSYLFNGPRPTITSAPPETTYGSTISVSTPDASSIRAVNLVSLGTDTHQMDMNQHFVPLSFTANGGSLSVTMPSSSATAPPGHYMLFILNDQGTPSVASIIGINQSTILAGPSAPAGATAATSPSDAVTPSAATSPSHAVTPSAATAPTFVQQASSHVSSASSVSVTPSAPLDDGNRLVVEVADWSPGHATAASVTDSAGDTFTELTTATGPDGTQLSVWTAPITQSGGTRPIIMARPTASADMGITVLEYSGLSTAAGAGAVDQMASAAGTTAGAQAVSSGATPATTAPGELSIGFYADSGFGDMLIADPGYTGRADVTPTGDIELFAEDTVVGQGAQPAPSVSTGAATIWEMATVVLKS